MDDENMAPACDQALLRVRSPCSPRPQPARFSGALLALFALLASIARCSCARVADLVRALVYPRR